MKIKSIDIASFGKLKNYHLELSDSFTVIFGENEKGKSTVMSFVRMMFYGNTGKVSSIDKNPRKKYRPWDTDFMAGSITFEHSGVTYRLEREFKASNSTDKISLINLDTNEKETLSGSEDIGAKFFGLTDGAFERSVFIGEPRLASKNEAADGEINARLSNIATTSDDDISFEKVYLRLRTAKEALISKSRKVGKLDKAEAELISLEQKIKEACDTEEKVIALKAEAIAKEEEIKESSQKASVLFDQLKNSDKIKKKNFVSRYIEAEKERAEAKEKLALKDGGYVDKAYISYLNESTENLSDFGEKISQNSALISEKQKDIEALKQSLASLYETDNGAVNSLEAKREFTDKNIDALRKTGEELQSALSSRKPQKKINLPLIIIGVVLAVTGIAGSALIAEQIVKIASLGAIAVGLLLFILGFVLKIKVMPDTSDITLKINENSAKLATLLMEKEAILEEIAKTKAKTQENDIKLASNKALLESKTAELEALIKEAEKLESTKTALGQEIVSHIGKLKHTNELSAQKIATELENALSYYEMISNKITVLADNAACSSLSEAEEKLALLNKDNSIADLTETEIDSLKENFKAQSDNTATLRTQLTSINEQIKTVTASTPSVAVLEREKAELEEKIKSYRNFTNTAEIAEIALDEAFRDLRKNYSEVLDQRTAEIFNKLSDDKYLSVSVSKSLDASVTTEDAFGTKESDYLSRGTEDQLYLAMRLAVAELITNESEKLPIFADDPLSQYDDNRTAKAMTFLKDYVRDKQLVMFTCHSFIKEAAEKENIKIIKM